MDVSLLMLPVLPSAWVGASWKVSVTSIFQGRDRADLYIN